MKILSFPEEAHLVTKATNELFDGVPTTSPITLTGTKPSVAFKCRATVSSVSGHTDCSGSLIIGSETLSFLASGGKKTTTVLLSALPTVSYTSLDCNILIECIDSGGADIKDETATATKIQFENTSSGFFTPEGVWKVYSGSYAMCRDAAQVNDVLRYNATDMPIKKVDVEKWFSKILYYIFYL
jgi:hypothetical protein